MRYSFSCRMRDFSCQPRRSSVVELGQFRAMHDVEFWHTVSTGECDTRVYLPVHHVQMPHVVPLHYSTRKWSTGPHRLYTLTCPVLVNPRNKLQAHTDQPASKSKSRLLGTWTTTLYLLCSSPAIFCLIILTRCGPIHAPTRRKLVCEVDQMQALGLSGLFQQRIGGSPTGHCLDCVEALPCHFLPYSP